MIAFLLAVLTWTATTPRTAPAGGMCADTSISLHATTEVHAHVRVSAAGTKVWEDSVVTHPGADWTMPKPALPAGTYSVLSWYSIPGAPAGCPHLQSWTISMPYVIDMSWQIQGGVFDSRTGQLVSVYEIQRIMNAYADTLRAAEVRAQMPITVIPLKKRKRP